MSCALPLLYPTLSDSESGSIFQPFITLELKRHHDLRFGLFLLHEAKNRYLGIDPSNPSTVTDQDPHTDTKAHH